MIFENQEDPYQNENPYIGSISKGPTLRELNKTIQKLWEMEELPQQKVRTKEEEKCEEIFTKEHSRDQFGRYIVRMPLKKN